ncbi:MAG: coproporphyrinogen III oxidase family protein [Gammaproteobacteria bacterium]|nr:coproporphyrinogen III oxidase family protein [Gammaproteobacteria bacterium]
MIYERLLLPFFRRESRRTMNFDEGEPGMPVPPPGGHAFLYVHIPFCTVLCPFCSFHRVEFREHKAVRYFAALRREIEAYRDAGFRFTGVYVGGGTPTVMPGELAKTLRLIRDSFPVKEISVETNPSDLTPEVLSQLADAGVDRLSVGVQSFDDGLLREMERYEKYGSSAEILTRLEAAAGRFRTLNVDMIFNLPHQTPEVLDADLDRVRSCGANQVSFYPLMTSDTVRRKMTARMGSLDRKRVRDYYEHILERLRPDFKASSAWCFSRGGLGIDEYIVDAGDYVGVGSGAFSYVNGTMYATTFSLNSYAERISRGLPAITRSRAMSLRDQLRYDLLVRLFGLSLEDDWLERRYGGNFRLRLAPEMLGLSLVGAVRRREGGWDLTERGMYLWVLMMSAFFESVNVFREDMRLHIREELEANEEVLVPVESLRRPDQA